MDPNWLLVKIALVAPLILSLALHELAHARTALAFGDPTAKHMGRCTLNPLVHLDPIGTISLVLVGFGWAKPVPVNPHNLNPPKMGSIAVSLAGPLSNLGLAIIVGAGVRGLLALGVEFSSPAGSVIWSVALYTMIANIFLFAFNMLPLFPLDGHHIVRDQLPGRLQAGFMHWQLRYGRQLLMAIVLGPRLLNLLNIHLFDPLSWVFYHAADVALLYVFA